MDQINNNKCVNASLRGRGMEGEWQWHKYSCCYYDLFGFYL